MENLEDIEVRFKSLEQDIKSIKQLENRTIVLEDQLRKAVSLLVRIVEGKEEITTKDITYNLLKSNFHSDIRHGMEVTESTVPIISLSDDNEIYILNIGGDFLDGVSSVYFHSESLEIHMKSGKGLKILHYWAYSELGYDRFSPLQKKELIEFDGCRFRFPKEYKVFLDYIWDESKRRNIRAF